MRHFEENSENVTKLLKLQLIIVKSSLGAVNSSLSDNHYNRNRVENALIQIKNFLGSTTVENRRDGNALEAKLTVESHITITEATETLQRYLDIILEA
jgi:hypothetical protein